MADMNGTLLRPAGAVSDLQEPKTSTLKAEATNNKMSASEKRKLRAKAKKLADRAERYTCS